MKQCVESVMNAALTWSEIAFGIYVNKIDW